MEKSNPLFKKLHSATRMTWWGWTSSAANALPQSTDCHLKRRNSKPCGSRSASMAEKMLWVSAGTGAGVGGRQECESPPPSVLSASESLCSPGIAIPFLRGVRSPPERSRPGRQPGGAGGSPGTGRARDTAPADLGNYCLKVQGAALVKTTFKKQMLPSKGNFLLRLNSLLLTAAWLRRNHRF